VLFGLGAYGGWGVFPLYFHLLNRSSALEIVLHRVLWSTLICLVVVAVIRGWEELRATLSSGRRTVQLGIAVVFLAVNWGTFVYAVNSGHVVEGSLGYFTNPLVTVLLGVVVLRETLRPGQWVAVGIGAAAVVILTVAYGRPPWIALTLAVTFAIYGLIKNRVGVDVGAVAGLTTESLLLAPAAAAVLVWLELTGQGHFTDNPPWQALLLVGAALATVVTLVMFAAAARRVPLSTMGLLQYVTPVAQLLCGVFFFGETLTPARWAGFAVVWLALAVLTVDGLRTANEARALNAQRRMLARS
jgi:chloramphenicol-sensitive protein RarD